MLYDEAGPVNLVGVVGSEARAGGRGGSFPLGLLEMGDEVAISLTPP